MKYLDPIIAATYSDDGTLQDVCRALAPKLQETNVIVRPHCAVPRCSWTSCLVEFSEQVVLKALIVLHTMIRNGHTDNTLNYIASSDILRLRHVANGERHGERSYPITFRVGLLNLVFAYRLSPTREPLELCRISRKPCSCLPRSQA